MQVEYGIEVDIYGFGVMMGELLAHQVNLPSLEVCESELHCRRLGSTHLRSKCTVKLQLAGAQSCRRSLLVGHPRAGCSC